MGDRRTIFFLRDMCREAPFFVAGTAAWIPHSVLVFSGPWLPDGTLMLVVFYLPKSWAKFCPTPAHVEWCERATYPFEAGI
jgi:hypothetical protein